MNLSKILALATLGISLSTSAFALPSLKAEVTVTAEIVTVGDMFDDVGSLAELAIFRAPKPGTTGMVELNAVRNAAKLVGLTEFENVGIARVRVSRAATLVDAGMLQTMVTDDLRNRGIVEAGVTPTLSFDTPNLSFNAEAVEQPVKLLNVRYTPGNSAFAARFQIAGTVIDDPVAHGEILGTGGSPDRIRLDEAEAPYRSFERSWREEAPGNRETPEIVATDGHR